MLNSKLRRSEAINRIEQIRKDHLALFEETSEPEYPGWEEWYNNCGVALAEIDRLRLALYRISSMEGQDWMTDDIFAQKALEIVAAALKREG